MTSIQLYIPESLGILDNSLAHINIANEHFTKETIQYRYFSSTGCEWSQIFCGGKEIHPKYPIKIGGKTHPNSSSFSFPIEIWDYIEGTFFLSFTAWKEEKLTFYTTNLYFFRKSDKFVVERTKGIP